MEKILSSKRSAREFHGLSGTALYRRYSTMLARCYMPSAVGFHKYGKRGIGVCRRWRESFLAFQEDMGPAPDPNASVGRVDNEWHYEPNNCRWETPKQQANNRRSSRILEAFGRTQTLQQWADEFDIHHTTILYRLRKGWNVERAITTPTNTSPRSKRAGSLANKSRAAGIDQRVVAARIHRGWDETTALSTPVKRGPTVADQARSAGLNPKTVYQRLADGWSMDRALGKNIKLETLND